MGLEKLFKFYFTPSISSGKSYFYFKMSLSLFCFVFRQSLTQQPRPPTLDLFVSNLLNACIKDTYLQARYRTQSSETSFVFKKGSHEAQAGKQGLMLPRSASNLLMQPMITLNFWSSSSPSSSSFPSTMQPWLAWNSVCRTGQPQTHRDQPLQSAWIKGTVPRLVSNQLSPLSFI